MELQFFLQDDLNDYTLVMRLHSRKTRWGQNTITNVLNGRKRGFIYSNKTRKVTLDLTQQGSDVC
jgi:hypothetical protein